MLKHEKSKISGNQFSHAHVGWSAYPALNCLYVCVSVCVCLCRFVCVCACVRACVVCVCVRVRVCGWICGWVGMWVSVCACGRWCGGACGSMWVWVWVWVCVGGWVCVCGCVWVWVYVGVWVYGLVYICLLACVVTQRMEGGAGKSGAAFLDARSLLKFNSSFNATLCSVSDVSRYVFSHTLIMNRIDWYPVKLNSTSTAFAGYRLRLNYNDSAVIGSWFQANGRCWGTNLCVIDCEFGSNLHTAPHSQAAFATVLKTPPQSSIAPTEGETKRAEGTARL